MTKEKTVQKATLHFNCDTLEGRSAARRALNADRAYLVLGEIYTEIFRPAFKHGYEDCRIQDLCNRIDRALGEQPGASDPDRAAKLIEMLLEKYREILDEYGIDLEDDRP